MSTRESLETDTRVIDAPDAPREIPEAENAVESPRGQVLDDPDRRREESAESQQRADGNGESVTFKVDRAELGRFDLRRAGLPNMSVESAGKYIDEHRDSRPWLAMTDHASPEARRIIAALDAASGRPHPARRLGNRRGEQKTRCLPRGSGPARPGEEVPEHRWSPAE
jgi:hypothetical protein